MCRPGRSRTPIEKILAHVSAARVQLCPTTNFDHLKFDGEFDIIILGGDYYGSPNSTTGFLFGKGSSATSIQINLTSGHSANTALAVL